MAHKPSRLLAEVLETAAGMQSVGVIDKRRMDEISALCHTHIDPMPPEEIKSIREMLNVSQSVFANLLNTSLSTIQKWEIGDKRPSGPSLKLLSVVKRHGISALA